MNESLMVALHWISLLGAIVCGMRFTGMFLGWLYMAGKLPMEVAVRLPMGMIYLWICIGSSIFFACT